MVTRQDFFELGKRAGQQGVKECAQSGPQPRVPHLLDGDVRTIVASLRPKQAAVTLPPKTAYLVFDTETTGRSNRAVVCQMAMAFVNANHEILCMYNKVWKLPRGRFMSKGSMKVHGITPLRIKERGVWPAAEMAQLEQTFKAAIAAKLPVVAFNANFDSRMLRQTADALGLRTWTLDVRHLTCTCSRSRVHSDLRNAKGARKGFTNAELFHKLFKRAPDGDLHDAATDVVVTACTYAMGRQKRWW
jgi:DNA polymerase III epsilon subunit-like protein